MRRRLLRVVVVCLSAMVLGQDGGCVLPQRILLSPDAQTLYLSLNDEAGAGPDETSNLYALQLETVELKALTDTPGSKTCRALSADGKQLVALSGGWPTCSHLLEIEERTILPLGDVTAGGALPTLIPGGGGTLLMSPAMFGQDGTTWRLYDMYDGLITTVEVKPPLPSDAIERDDVPAVAPNRAALVLALDVGEEPDGKDDDAPGHYGVYVITITPRHTVITEKGAPGKPDETEDVPATATARRVADFRLRANPMRRFHVAFSPDGRRLLVTLSVKEGEKEHADFYEVDPAGKAPPKRLFRDTDAAQPQWTPDGTGVVYLRDAAGDLPWVEVVLNRFGNAFAPAVLARFPRYKENSNTCFRWHHAGKRLTIAHQSDDGIRLVRADDRGKVLSSRWLSREKLRVLRHLADIERPLDRAAVLGRRPLTGDLAKRFEGVRKALAKLKAVDKEMDAVWETVNDYDPIRPAPLATSIEDMPEKFRKLRLKTREEKRQELMADSRKLERENKALMRELEELLKKDKKPK